MFVSRPFSTRFEQGMASPMKSERGHRRADKEVCFCACSSVLEEEGKMDGVDGAAERGNAASAAAFGHDSPHRSPLTASGSRRRRRGGRKTRTGS